MGDCGSMLLGYLFALYSMGGDGRPQPLALLIPVVALGVPVLDTGLSIVRRLIECRPICGADGDHIHHRFLRRGTHRGADALRRERRLRRDGVCLDHEDERLVEVDQ